MFLLQGVSSYSDTTLFNYIRSLTCFICFILTIYKTLRMSVFNKELLTYLHKNSATGAGVGFALVRVLASAIV